MTQVFISYSRKDLEFVDRLANDLKAAGFEVWYDLSGLEPGTRWRLEIQKAIQESQFFLVVLSPNSIVSDWVEREFLFASDQKLKIIPLLYQPCTLPMWSLNLHFIDMQGKNYSLHYQDLLKVMGVRSSLEENPIAIRYIEIGDEYRKRGRAAQAIESYQKALEVEPGNLKAHINIAAVYLSEQAYTESAAAYELALQIANADLVARAGWSDANLALGNQARAEGKLDEAIRCYLKILKVIPEDGDARQSLANIYISQADRALADGKLTEAILAYREAQKYAPDDPDIPAKLIEIKGSIRRSDLQTTLDKADEAARTGKWSDALGFLSQVLAEDPDNSVVLEKQTRILAMQREGKLKALRTRARDLLKEQKFEQALAAWNETLLLDPEERQVILAEIEAVKRSQKLEADYSEGMQAYNAKDYQKALLLFERLQLESSAYKDSAKFLAKTRKLADSGQKKDRMRGWNAWLTVSVLTILALGIGAIVIWTGKDHPTLPPLVATKTSTIIATSSPSASPPPQTRIITVTSTEDEGPGTLRQALLEARAGDTITFDPAIFPPDAPVAINLYSALPVIDQGNLTLDASNAGVVLNGAHVGGDWVPGMDVWSDNNTLKGLGIIGFSGAGIALQANANFNTIGGDRDVGYGQAGEGNFLGTNQDGLAVWGSDNMITGNLIGILGADSEDLDLGNKASGIFLDDSASRNTIGPDNIIAYNGTSEGGCGIEYTSLEALENDLTANLIFGNKPGSPGICYNINPGGQFVYSTPPTILFFNLESGSAAGVTCPNCRVEIFSTDSLDARVYEGTVTADEFGNFVLNKDSRLTGPYLTATSRSPGENTSELSLPTPKNTDLMIALDGAWVQKPVFESAFNTWMLSGLDPNASIETGKLVITTKNTGETLVELNKFNTDKYATEFEILISDADPGGSNCLYRTSRNVAGETTRMFELNFSSNGEARLGFLNAPEDFPGIAAFRFDPGLSNKLKLVLVEDQVAVFINEQIVFATILPGSSVVYLEQKFGSGRLSTCKFDNFKFWDLSGVTLNP